MARHTKFGWWKDQQGSVINAETLTVTLTGTTTVATIYENEAGGSAITNGAITLSSVGFFQYWVDEADYATTQRFRHTFTGGKFDTLTLDDIVIFPGITASSTDNFTNKTFDDQVLVDATGTEAVLIRKNSDGGDVFVVDTSGDEVIVNANLGIGTGTSIDEDVHVQSATSAKPVVKLENTNADANGAILEFKKNTSGEADNDVLGLVEFRGNDSGANEEMYASIEGVSSDVSNGNEGGEITLRVQMGSTLRNLLNINGYNGTVNDGEVIINEDSQDVDFRVESNGNTNALFVDGANNRVGILNGSPSTALDVTGAVTVSSTITSTGAVTANSVLLTGITLGTEQASGSGTAIDFTSIPAGVKKITIMFEGVSTDGTNELLIQLGDAGGVEASGYLCGVSSSSAADNSTTGFIINTAGAAAGIYHGSIVLKLKDAANFTWVSSSGMGASNAAAAYSGGGSKSLSAELDRVRITSTGTPDDFDAGSINIQYE